MAEWQEWRNGGMAEWHKNGRMAEWQEWQNGIWNGGMTDGMAEWQEWRNGRVFEESCERESRVGEGVVAKRSSTRG